MMHNNMWGVERNSLYRIFYAATIQYIYTQRKRMLHVVINHCFVFSYLALPRL